MGRQLHELMGWPGPMTHRQFLVWCQWIKDQWNQPTLTDHYLMRIAWRVTQLVYQNARMNPGQVTEADQQIEFVEKSQQTGGISLIRPMSEKTRLAIHKATWDRRMGPPARKSDGN